MQLHVSTTILMNIHAKGIELGIFEQMLDSFLEMDFPEQNDIDMGYFTKVFNTPNNYARSF